MLRQKVFYPAGRVVSPMETQKKKKTNRKPDGGAERPC